MAGNTPTAKTSDACNSINDPEPPPKEVYSDDEPVLLEMGPPVGRGLFPGSSRRDGLLFALNEHEAFTAKRAFPHRVRGIVPQPAGIRAGHSASPLGRNPVPPRQLEPEVRRL